MRAALGWVVFLALAVAAYHFGRDYVRRHPEQVPWTALDLRDPVGPFTLRKLAKLTEQPALCRALISQAELEDAPVAPRNSGQCGYADGMRLTSEGRSIGYAPSGVVTSCPVAAALSLWERSAVQPAAERHLGARVAVIEHAGSYSCRRLYGRSEGAFSEHATADAFDVLGFRLADGRRISVLRDWTDGGPEAAFLHEVRNGACPLFATVLSPDYNAAHSDHLHLDMAERGKMGWRVCN